MNKTNQNVSDIENENTSPMKNAMNGIESSNECSQGLNTFDDIKGTYKSKVEDIKGKYKELSLELKIV